MYGRGEHGGVDIILGILPTCDGPAACYAAVDAASGPIEEAGISYVAVADSTFTSMFSRSTNGGEVFSDRILIAGTYTIDVRAFEPILAGWTLAMATIAAPVCGDGIVGVGEACDDNMVANDGCTACVVDLGFVCDNATDPSVCVSTCGDGVVDAGEECDDGNMVDDDRCADMCLLNADVVDLAGNDDFMNAQPIIPGQVARGSLDPNGVDVFDLYSFVLTETSWVTLEQYTTFGAGDSDFTESVAEHFGTRRISFFFDDLRPHVAGLITLDEFADHLTITSAAVNAGFAGNEINVQIQFFDTGVIVMTYLTVTEGDCLVGISAGDNFGAPARAV